MPDLDTQRAAPPTSQPENTPFYAELGEVIAHSGHARVAEYLLHLVNKWVPIHCVDLSECTLDEPHERVIDIKRLGSAGQHPARPLRLPSGPDHPLWRAMLDMQDPLLIQMNARLNSPQPWDNLHQCHLVSRQGDRRWVISFSRPCTERGFSLSQLSFLKRLSETLLPLLEHHAHLLRQAPCPPPEPGLALSQPSHLQQAFYQRLSLDDISLSAREQEVCLGLLTGGTVPQLAEKLSVKNSSIETYLKRAAAKLGVSGRHGLAKWMIGTGESGYGTG